MKNLVALITSSLMGLSLAIAQPVPFPKPPEGTVVTLRAQAETVVNNNEALIEFFVQEQAADRAEAASRANRKIKEAIERIKQLDSSAEIRTGGYNTDPTYGTDNRVITSWQVRQYITVTTRNLSNLEKLTARVQSVASIGSISFGVSREAQRKINAQLLDMAFADFRARIAAVAKALGKTEKDIEIEEINLDDTPRFSGQQAISFADASPARSTKSGEVVEGKFESGDSRHTASFTARIRVKR